MMFITFSSHQEPRCVQTGCPRFWRDLGGTYLEESLVVPLGIDLAQLGGDPVVLPHEEGVDHGQHGLLVHPEHDYWLDGCTVSLKSE